MDPISDMLIRIKNAQVAGHKTVQIPYSKFKQEVAGVLEKHKMLGKTERKGKRVRKFLECELAYKNEEPAIHEVKLISKPSRRLYASIKKLARPRHGGLIILSTPKGMMCEAEARRQKVGGEVLAEIW